MAYIRKRGKTYSYTVEGERDPATGERGQITKGGYKSEKEAIRAAAKVEDEIAEGTFVKPTKMTFREFAESWLIFYASTGEVKEGSVQVRRSRLNKLLKYFGGAQLTKISRNSYQNMLLKLKNEEKLANETIISTHATAKLIFHRAIELGVMKVDPTQYARVPRHQLTVEEIESGDELPKYMEKEELAQFLQTAKERGLDNDFATFMTLAYTGLRIGELAALKWSDIDLDAMTIRITKTYQNIRNNTQAYKLVPPKTKASIRTIEFDEVVKEVLEAHSKKLKTYMMRYRNRYYNEGFAFPNVGVKYPGYPQVQKNIEERMKRLLELEAMSTELTPHSLRHTHTTLLAEAGASLQETMERLGHKDDHTTRLVYMHVTKSMKRGAAQKFSNLMRDVVKM